MAKTFSREEQHWKHGYMYNVLTKIFTANSLKRQKEEDFKGKERGNKCYE
jgi:hypothetical protein